MTELRLPNTPKESACFWTLLVSQLYILCSFVVSHPLYFSYMVFFSPYLFRILSFLSPLFVTTSLLLTFSPAIFHGSSATPLLPESAAAGTDFLHAAVRSLLDVLRFISDDEREDFHGSPRFFQDLEEFMEVFEAIPEEGRSQINSSYSETASFSSSDYAETASLCSSDYAETTPISCSEEDRIASLQPASTNQETAGESQGKYDCGVEDYEARVQAKRTGSEVDVKHGNDELVWRAAVDGVKKSEGKHICAGAMSPNLGRSMGSMRQEKEWKRTLACKLFEERHSGGSGEGEGGEDMDSLWETYEAESNSKVLQGKKKKNKNREKGGKKKVSKKVDLYIGGGEKDDEEGEDDEEGVGQLCCLQALTFSAGKMNLGMGRPGMAKISKTFKGFGWLRHLGRHARK